MVSLEDAIKAARETADSPKLISVRNLRDKLAHRLKRTRAEMTAPGTVHPAKYGDEKDLLEETINIVDGLHLGINGTKRNWEDARRIAQKNARALWEHCSFDIQD
jgi:AbiU2